jgi:predicted outer membrane lipoprotein
MLECDVSNDLGETMEIFLWILGGLAILASVFVLAMITAVFVEGTESGLDDD